MERKQHIAISGATGFIGAYLAEYFVAKGHPVTGLVRKMPHPALDGMKYEMASLETPPTPSVFEGIDIFIHCAYVKGEEQLNINGTKNYLSAARKAGVSKSIFISSMAAHSGALSAYGKQKYQLEKEFLGNDAIVRPGLVIGDGGLFNETVNHIKTKGFIPLIAGGKQPLYTMHIEDLAKALTVIIEKNLNGSYYVAEAEAIAYKDFYAYLAQRLGKKIRLVPVSYGILNLAFSILEMLGIKLGVGKENLLGLKAAKRFDIKPDLERLGIQPMTYKESVDKLL